MIFLLVIIFKGNPCNTMSMKWVHLIVKQLNANIIRYLQLCIQDWASTPQLRFILTGVNHKISIYHLLTEQEVCMGESWPRSWVQTERSEVCTHDRGACWRFTLVFLEGNSQYFCSLVYTFVAAKCNRSRCRSRWENLDRGQYRFQPIKFVNSVVPSPCETPPHNN